MCTSFLIIVNGAIMVYHAKGQCVCYMEFIGLIRGFDNHEPMRAMGWHGRKCMVDECFLPLGNMDDIIDLILGKKGDLNGKIAAGVIADVVFKVQKNP
jgi:hypothetical protein